MEKIPCSVGILTFNSAATLQRALESVKEFNDIVICDGGSTDGTLAIAKKFGARVIEQDRAYKNIDGTLRDYSGVRNQLLGAAKNNWFLYIDSDETISDGLCEDIRTISSRDSGDSLVYQVPIGILMDGRYLKYSSNYPGYQFRFFDRRSGARFAKPVHERISFDTDTVAIGTLTHPWYVHTTRNDWRHYFRDNRRYRDLEVARAIKQNRRDFWIFTVWGTLRTAGGVILRASRNYLLHGFRDSVPVSGEIGRICSTLAAGARVAWRHFTT